MIEVCWIYLFFHHTPHISSLDYSGHISQLDRRSIQISGKRRRTFIGFQLSGRLNLIVT